MRCTSWMAAALLAFMPLAPCLAQHGDPDVFVSQAPPPRAVSPPPAFVPPPGSALTLENGDLVLRGAPSTFVTFMPLPAPGSRPVGTACISGPHPRPGETVPQIQWRACQMAGCYLCPDGRPFSAPRDTIPPEWLPN